MMKGLTAKCFRTYNASFTLEQELNRAHVSCVVVVNVVVVLTSSARADSGQRDVGRLVADLQQRQSRRLDPVQPPAHGVVDARRVGQEGADAGARRRGGEALAAFDAQLAQVPSASRASDTRASADVARGRRTGRRRRRRATSAIRTRFACARASPVCVALTRAATGVEGAKGRAGLQEAHRGARRQVRAVRGGGGNRARLS